VQRFAFLRSPCADTASVAIESARLSRVAGIDRGDATFPAARRDAARAGLGCPVLRKLRESVATLGVADTLLYAAARFADRASGGRVRIVKYYFTAQPVVPPAGPQRSGSFTLDWAARDAPQFAQIERPSHVIASRFAQGARCLMATTNEGDLAGFLWFVVGPYEEDEVRVRFVPSPVGEAAWDFDVAIVPRFRMGRLFSYLWSRAASELAHQGVTHTMSRVSAFNAASIASHRRLGARIVGDATFVCAGPVQLMHASRAPRWHLSWRREKRPVVTIHV
jgi:hypothetical protein